MIVQDAIETNTRRLGKYRLVRTIASREKTDVFEAVEDGLPHSVALKVLRRASAEAVVVKRFQREAMTAASMSHDHIVPVYDAGQIGGRHFYAMKLISGTDLRNVRTQLRTSEEERDRELSPIIDRFKDPQFTVEVVRQVLSALAYAHDQGVIHRDIKPTNVMVDKSGKAWLADFGTAKLTEAISESLSATGSHLSGIRYAAPELLCNDESQCASVDHRSDICSIGKVFYEFITGTLPCSRSAARRSEKEIFSIPKSLERVLVKASMDRIDKRFQTAGEFIEALDGVSLNAFGSVSLDWVQNLCDRFLKS